MIFGFEIRHRIQFRLVFESADARVCSVSAVLILAIMMIPFTSSVAREVLKAVPHAQRETAYALAATKWTADASPHLGLTANDLPAAPKE
jgi:ABC-type phosphate transport system permease subunit